MARISVVHSTEYAYRNPVGLMRHRLMLRPDMVFAPWLDEAGNSVKGQLAARYLSERLGFSLFASQAEP